MHQHATGTNEVNMEILNLKVEYLNRLIQFLTPDSINESIFAVLELQPVVQLQLLCGNPALTLHIEGMPGGTGDGLAIDLNMNPLALLIPEDADDTLQRPPVSGPRPRPSVRRYFQIYSIKESKHCQ